MELTGRVMTRDLERACFMARVVTLDRNGVRSDFGSTLSLDVKRLTDTVFRSVAVPLRMISATRPSNPRTFGSVYLWRRGGDASGPQQEYR